MAEQPVHRQPAPPRRERSFTDFQVHHPRASLPGDWVDGEFARTHQALAATLEWASVSLRSDGSLNPEAVRLALNGHAPKGIDNSANDAALGDVVAQDYAVLSRAWAEYLPDTIPPNILASNDITGDHWSSRWWANHAAQIVQGILGRLELVDLSHVAMDDYAQGLDGIAGIEGGAGGIEEPDLDGLIHGRSADLGWVPVLPLSGGALGGKLNIGSIGWLEAVIGGTESISEFVSLSRVGGPAGVFGTRTSDGHTVGAQGAWAIGGFTINNNTTEPQTGYGGYIEVRRYPGTDVTEGLEIATVNLGDVKQGSAHNWAQFGCTIGLLMGAGRGDVIPNNNPTTAIVVAGGDARWQTGIIFGEHSLATNGGFPIAPVAIDLPQGYCFLWRDANDLPAASIRSDVSLSPDYHGAGQIIFTNGGVQINANDGQASMLLGNSGPLVNGDIVTTNNGNISSDNSVTAKRAVIADHVLGFRSGTGFGGAVGSWDTSSGRAAGMRFDASFNGLSFGALDPVSGSLTSVVASLTSTGQFSTSGPMYAVSLDVSGNVSAGSSGVRYPGVSALGSGANHAFGFDWNGTELTVWVDGTYRGRIPMTLPRADELEARIAALEARIATLEAAAP